MTIEEFDDKVANLRYPHHREYMQKYIRRLVDPNESLSSRKSYLKQFFVVDEKYGWTTTDSEFRMALMMCADNG
jgi:hypothetical protein